MYQIIQSFINHTWVTGSNAPGDQAYIMAFSLIVLCVMLVVVVDLVRSVFDRFLK